MTSSSSVGWNLNPGANAVGGGAGSDGVSRRILFEIFFLGWLLGFVWKEEGYR